MPYPQGKAGASKKGPKVSIPMPKSSCRGSPVVRIPETN